MDKREELPPQQMAIELCNELTPHDVIAFGDLSPDALVTQYEARQVLFDHIDAMWDKANNDGHDPANDPRFSAIAALRAPRACPVDLAEGMR